MMCASGCGSRVPAGRRRYCSDRCATRIRGRRFRALHHIDPVAPNQPPWPGLTLDELVARTGRPRAVLELALRDEARRPGGHVEEDAAGRFYWSASSEPALGRWMRGVGPDDLGAAA